MALEQYKARSPASAEASPAAQSMLVDSCQGLVRNIAWKIHQKLPKQVELDDLIGYGQVGLVQAAQHFDPTRGGQFTTYAYYRIRGAILDGLSQMSWFSKHDYHASRYERAAADIAELNAGESAAHPPAENSSSDLGEETGWFAELAVRLSVAYLSAHAGGDEGAGSNLVDSQTLPPADAIARELREKLLQVIESLPDDARSLIRATYFEGLTLQAAGGRLGISKAWASRLHARALDRMGRALRRQNVGP